MLYAFCLGSGIRYDKDRVQTSANQGDGRLCDIADIETRIRALACYRQAAKATILWMMDGAGLTETQRQMVILRHTKPGTTLAEIARRLELGSDGKPNEGCVHRALAQARRKMLAQDGRKYFGDK